MILALLSAASAQPADEPLALYLTEQEIQERLLAPDWQSCVTGDTPELTVPVSFRILPSGETEVLSVEAPEPLSSCWTERVTALRFRAHQEDPLLIRWTLGVRAGRAIPYPAFQAENRQIYPFFLFIPPDAPAGLVEQLLQTLEVGERGAAP